MSSLIVGAIVAAIGMLLSRALLQRLFPVKAIMSADSSFADLKSRYQTWALRLGALTLFIATPLSGVFWLLLKSLASWHAGRPPIIFVPAVGAYWLLPAFLLGLVGGGVVALWIAQRLLGERYSEFLAYCSLSSGVNPVRANVLASQACTFVCAGLIFIGLRADL
ncbi:MAG TPA: hypothetical protein VNU65_00150 [Xanthobacteraceae bacterium]|nr:hypothetical protein [Xanthobacteraceae bacterium]